MRVWITEMGEPLPLDKGFREFRCGMLLRQLAAANHEVTWWTSTFHHMTKTHRFGSSQWVDHQPGIRFRLLFAPGYKSNISYRRVIHNRSVARQFYDEAQREDPPDIIFSCMPTPEVAQSAVRYSVKMKVPVLVDIRDLWPDIYLSILPSPLRAAARMLLASEFRRISWLCSHATGLTAVSDSYLNWALAYAGRQQRQFDRVFPIGFPTRQLLSHDQMQSQIVATRERFCLKSEDVVLLFLGIFGATYDLETAIQAVKSLSPAYSSRVKLVLAGDGENAWKLKQQAANSPNIIFTGWVDQPTMLSLLALSSAALCPYVSGAPQSLPNKPFEAFAAGVPVLSSLEGELSALVNRWKVGANYRAGDVRCLTERIEWLLRNPRDWATMGRNARTLLESQFSSETVYSALVGHLERVAKSAGNTWAAA